MTADRSSNQNRELIEQIHSLQREDKILHNILAVDVWAIAKTMDEYQPGFWAAFMKNREQAQKRWLDEVMNHPPMPKKRPPFLQ